MKRDFLKELGIEDDAINAIMAENGKDIENVKSKYADYDDVKKSLEDANKKIESFGDVDAIKAEVEKWKNDFKQAQADNAAKIAKMERMGKIKDFTSAKHFVNDFTRDAINSQLDAELDKEENKGKSLADILDGLTRDKKDIFVDENKPTPPKMAPAGTQPTGADDDAKIRAIMGLPVKD